MSFGPPDTDWTSWAYTANTRLLVGAPIDPNGNLASDGLTSYTWNARDQLTGLSGGTSARFAYDGTGRRRGKTISGTTTNFFYDGLNLVQELTSGGTPTANLLTGLGIDETFTRADAGGTSTLLGDALGSTIELASGSGSLQTHYTYEAFEGRELGADGVAAGRHERHLRRGQPAGDLGDRALQLRPQWESRQRRADQLHVERPESAGGIERRDERELCVRLAGTSAVEVDRRRDDELLLRRSQHRAGVDERRHADGECADGPRD